MKQLLSLCALLLVASGLFAQKDVTFWPDGTIRSEVRLVNGERVGPYTEYYKTGERSLQVTYRQGRREGMLREWYPSGAIKALGNYVNGGLEGKYEVFFEKGGVKTVYRYVGGQLDGPSVAYHPGGQRKEVMFYVGGAQDSVWQEWDVEGKRIRSRRFVSGVLREDIGFYPNGIKAHLLIPGKMEQRWHPSGKLAKQTDFAATPRHNKITEWNESGAKLVERFVFGGETDSIYREWYANGKPKLEANYRSGIRDGFWVEWHSNGQMSRKQKFSRGFPDGSFDTWYDNGQQRSHELTGDKKYGAESFWHPNGKLAFRANYERGSLHGAVEEWYEDGKRKSKKNYRHDSATGVWESWHMDGSPARYTPVGPSAKGTATLWYENGKKCWEATYEEGARKGPFAEWYPDGQPRVQGAYANESVIRKNGKEVVLPKSSPDGDWTYYYPNGKVKREGRFDRGIEVGEWVYYDSSGAVINRADFESLSRKPEIFDLTEEPPTFPGGPLAFETWFDQNFNHPEDAVHGKQRGTILVELVLNQRGEFSSAKVLRGLRGEVYPHFVAQALQRMPAWKPAAHNGKFVHVRITVPVTIR